MKVSLEYEPFLKTYLTTDCVLHTIFPDPILDGIGNVWKSHIGDENNQEDYFDEATVGVAQFVGYFVPNQSVMRILHNYISEKL